MAAARAALDAHAVLCFDFDREKEKAYLRAADGPAALMRDSVLDLTGDPFAFLLERGESFYATDFKRLLWSLPYYKGEVKVGSMIAVPVRAAGMVRGALVVDKLEVQALGGDEPALVQAFAGLVAEAMGQLRAAASREDVGTEFKAVYGVSRQIASLTDPVAIRVRLLSCARLVAHEGGGHLSDKAQTRYIVERGGLGQQFEAARSGCWADVGGLAAQVRRVSLLLDDLPAAGTACHPRLDSEAARAQELTGPGPRGEDDRGPGPHGEARHVRFRHPARLSIVATRRGRLHAGQMMTTPVTSRSRRLTSLYNRRASRFSRPVHRARGPAGWSFRALPRRDRFKKLNDLWPSGDAALRHTAQLLTHRLRKSVLAARFGREEFAVLLASTDLAGRNTWPSGPRSSAAASSRRGGSGVTVSIGVAVWPGDGREPAALAAADRALYGQKAVAAAWCPRRHPRWRSRSQRPPSSRWHTGCESPKGGVAAG